MFSTLSLQKIYKQGLEHENDCSGEGQQQF
jgi:hypothetical protein